MAQASEQKLWPSRTTAWDTWTSQVQRGQAQGVAGAITTNQFTVAKNEKQFIPGQTHNHTHDSRRNIDNDSHITPGITEAD